MAPVKNAQNSLMIILLRKSAICIYLCAFLIGCKKNDKVSSYQNPNSNIENKDNDTVDKNEASIPSEIMQFIKVGIHRNEIEKKFGKPNRYVSGDALYEAWDPRIPSNASKKGLCGVYITYSKEGKVVSWVSRDK